MKKIIGIAVIMFMLGLLPGFADESGMELNKKIRVNGIELYVRAIGRGEPLIVVHGGPGLAHNYLFKHFRQLADSYRVIFYDQRATGLSTGEDNPANINMKMFVSDLEALRSYFGFEKVHMIGQSFGGLLAMQYAVKYPERLKSLVLCESAGSSPDFILNCQYAIGERLTLKQQEQLKKISSPENFKRAPGKTLADSLKIRFSAYFFDKSRLDLLDLSYFTDQMAEKIRVLDRAMRDDLMSFDLNNRLSRISCPTLIMHGEFDPIPYESLKKTASLIPGAVFVLIKESGHFIHLEKPVPYFSNIRNFLKNPGNFRPAPVSGLTSKAMVVKNPCGAVYFLNNLLKYGLEKAVQNTRRLKKDKEKKIDFSYVKFRGLGDNLTAMENHRAAAAVFEMCLDDRPGDPALLCRLARVYMQLNDRPAAVQCLKKAKESAPGDADVKRMLDELKIK